MWCLKQTSALRMRRGEEGVYGGLQGVHKPFKNSRKSIQVELGDAPRGQNSAETIIFIVFDIIAKVYIMEGPDALESCRAS